MTLLALMLSKDIFKSAKGKRVTGVRTICEIHREIYDAIVLDELDRAIALLEEAFFMGTRMAKRMIEKKIYDLDFDKEKDGASEESRRLKRQERIRLQELLEDLS